MFSEEKWDIAQRTYVTLFRSACYLGFTKRFAMLNRSLDLKSFVSLQTREFLLLYVSKLLHFAGTILYICVLHDTKKVIAEACFLSGLIFL